MPYFTLVHKDRRDIGLYPVISDSIERLNAERTDTGFIHRFSTPTGVHADPIYLDHHKLSPDEKNEDFIWIPIIPKKHYK